jgi:ferrous iron transport protein B
MINQNINIALIGNPNTGKTSVFNQLTGLNQQVGNYPGITVEKKLVSANYPIMLRKYRFTWYYSLNASSIDENVVIEL